MKKIFGFASAVLLSAMIAAPAQAKDIKPPSDKADKDQAVMLYGGYGFSGIQYQMGMGSGNVGLAVGYTWGGFGVEANYAIHFNGHKLTGFFVAPEVNYGFTLGRLGVGAEVGYQWLWNDVFPGFTLRIQGGIEYGLYLGSAGVLNNIGWGWVTPGAGITPRVEFGLGYAF